METPRPIEKNLVLVGAGNAHLKFVKRFGMAPRPGLAVTLVNEASRVPYSAMVPAFIGGEYPEDAITMDLVRLCAWAKVRFLRGRVTAITPTEKQVRVAGRPALAYDVLSLGIGSVPTIPQGLEADPRSISMRPLRRLLDRLDELPALLGGPARRARLAVVGGGASGSELALAIHKRLQGMKGLEMTLLHAGERLLPQHPQTASHAFADAVRARGIALRLQARVVGAEGDALVLESGERVPFDVVLWATTGAPPPLLRDSGLPLDPAGFLRVHPTLQSEGDPAIFGTGDCIALSSHPDLPRNGVYAVREGDVLWENAWRFLDERPLEPFRPQKRVLALFNTADGDAVLSYGAFATKGKRARALKESIDRRWMARFTELPEMDGAAPGEPEPFQMRCGGCGNKVSADVLSAALGRIEIPDDPRVVLGTHAGEDAAVFRPPPPGMLELQTVDYFKAFVDDPYLFGRIAALNSVSDIYAMNGRPFSALAIATLPHARGPIQEGVLYEMLSGAVESLKAMGVVLAGGHTTEGPELALGFSVTGYAEDGTLFRKGGAEPGDKLVLTKPIGTGALLAAWMRGACRASWYDALVESMLVGNGPAAQVFRAAGVRGCTDVTGFGLAGHLLEMAEASRCAFTIEKSRVPVYEGFDDVVRKGIVSTLQKDNAKASDRVQGLAPEWLFDPQTSGGLVAAVRPAAVASVLEALRAAGYPRAAAIGEVAALRPGEAPELRLG